MDAAIINQNTHFLIVDDDEVDVMMVQKILIEIDSELMFTVAKNGEEGLEKLAQIKAMTEDNAQVIVLLDLNMPRMDGHAFLEEMRKDPALMDTIVFVLSTSGEPADVRRSYSNFVSGYIPKDRLNAKAFRGLLENYISLVAMPGSIS